MREEAARARDDAGSSTQVIARTAVTAITAVTVGPTAAAVAAVTSARCSLVTCSTREMKLLHAAAEKAHAAKLAEAVAEREALVAVLRKSVRDAEYALAAERARGEAAEEEAIRRMEANSMGRLADTGAEWQRRLEEVQASLDAATAALGGERSRAAAREATDLVTIRVLRTVVGELDEEVEMRYQSEKGRMRENEGLARLIINITTTNHHHHHHHHDHHHLQHRHS